MKDYKNIYAILAAIILIGSAFYYQNQQKRADCLARIDYHAGSNVYSIEGLEISSDNPTGIKHFKTHDEAMEWCMKVLFK